MVGKFVGLTSCVALVFSPALAQAQSCDGLRAQLAGTSGDLLGIAADYPKTHVAIVACMMNNPTDDERLACAGAMVVAACIGLGSEGCYDLTSRWDRVGRAYQRIASDMRVLGCRQ